MAHAYQPPSIVEPTETERSNPLVQFVQSMTAEELAVIEGLAALDRAGVDEANELAEFARTHDGLSPGEWLRRRDPVR